MRYVAVQAFQLSRVSLSAPPREIGDWHRGDYAQTVFVVFRKTISPSHMALLGFVAPINQAKAAPTLQAGRRPGVANEAGAPELVHQQRSYPCPVSRHPHTKSEANK